MRIAITDDIASDRKHLAGLLQEYCALNRLPISIDQFSCGEELLQEYQPLRYTMIFLDIFMDGLSGIETAEKIRAEDEDAIIIFLTTSEAHRPEAFSVFASAYLNKNTPDDQVFRVMDHILKIRTKMDKVFSFAYDRKEYSLRYTDIISIETDGNYLVITDRRKKTYRTRMTFSQAEKILDQRFLTLMKGIMVNMDSIKEIRDHRCTMLNGSVFPLRVKDAKEIKQKWLNYKFLSIREETSLTGVKTEC